MGRYVIDLYFQDGTSMICKDFPGFPLFYLCGHCYVLDSDPEMDCSRWCNLTICFGNDHVQQVKHRTKYRPLSVALLNYRRPKPIINPCWQCVLIHFDRMKPTVGHWVDGSMGCKGGLPHQATVLAWPYSGICSSKTKMRMECPTKR